ncbi:cell wall assembly regulator SMI1 [Roseimicrobium gellanilyticum]|uniref:Cell wall assembly regulator SMI1 n=1 Tax=Roseimicrobium gellanilyticum TaxID=748857 RepID=A0A366HPB2_9BACT|nr:SMI1/KNR4 family protein [Roseimicrobium gellanilyticum]RBP45350.1 cell wall assembly regulator SMI1 [Roseimicrobium gellanilyticum]
MKALWLRIDKWLAEHAPEVLEGLNPPATLEQIRAAEKCLGCVFPQDVVDSFLVHDGARPGCGLWSGWDLLSLEGVVREWECWKELVNGGAFHQKKSVSDGDITDSWYDLKWIPLTYQSAGDNECLDLNPGKKGTVGQIISVYHDDPNRGVVASSYRAWMAAFADDLEAGGFVLDEDGCLSRFADRVDEWSPVEYTVWHLDNEVSADAHKVLRQFIQHGNTGELSATFDHIIAPPMIQPMAFTKWFGAKAKPCQPCCDDAVRTMVALEFVAEAIGRGHATTPAALTQWIRSGHTDAVKALQPVARRALDALQVLANSDAAWEVRASEWHAAAASLVRRFRT